MNFFHKCEVADCVSTQSWAQLFCKFFELLEMLSKLDCRYIIDDVQHGHACASIGDRLARS